MLVFANISLDSYVALAVAQPKLLIIVPLSVACLAIFVAIPMAASRGKFHIAGYVGIAFASFGATMMMGRLSGTRGVSGTPIGLVLSLLSFSGISIALGCLVALFFYKPPGGST